MPMSMNLLLGFLVFISSRRAFLSSSREVLVSPSGILGKKFVSDHLGFLIFFPVLSADLCKDTDVHPTTCNFYL